MLVLILEKTNFFMPIGASRTAPDAPTGSAPQLPYPTQYLGGMPVPYANPAPPGAPQGVQAPYYVPPPMPASYNPYATIPYPQPGNFLLFIKTKAFFLSS